MESPRQAAVPDATIYPLPPVVGATAVTAAAPNRFPHFPFPLMARCAFSLLELLVVIAVISILLVAGASIMSGPSPGMRVQSAANSAAGLVELARHMATTDQRGSRIVMDMDPQSRGYLRRFAVVRKTGDNQWRMESKPLLLPDGAYVFPDYIQGAQTATFNFQNPAFGSGSTVNFFEFDGTGNLVLPDGQERGRIVFVAGILSGPPYSLRIPANRELTRDGFIIRRSGVVTRYESPDQIEK